MPTQEDKRSPTVVLRLRVSEQYLHFSICLYHMHKNNFTFIKTKVHYGLIYPKIRNVLRFWWKHPLYKNLNQTYETDNGTHENFIYTLMFLLYQVIILSHKYHLSLPITTPVLEFAGHIVAMVYMTSEPSVRDK